jgi:hypothetical protein
VLLLLQFQIFQESNLAKRAPRPIPPGISGDLLVDEQGVHYQRLLRHLEPHEARAEAQRGGRVVFDECGCGGTCGFIWNSDERSLELGQWDPILIKNKKNAGTLSLWQSESGRKLVLAQGLVTWDEPN